MKQPLICKAYDALFSQRPNLTLFRELDRVSAEIERRERHSHYYGEHDEGIADLVTDRAMLEHYLTEQGHYGMMPVAGAERARAIYERNRRDNIATYGLLSLPILSIGSMSALIATPFQNSDAKAIACATAGTLAGLAAATLFDQLRKLR